MTGRDWRSLLWLLFVINVVSPIVADALKNFGLVWPVLQVGTFLVALVLIFAEMLLIDGLALPTEVPKLREQIVSLSGCLKAFVNGCGADAHAPTVALRLDRHGKLRDASSTS